MSQVSPTGADNLEDLAVFDPSDPSQRLLVAVEARGDDLVIYRHLFTVDGGSR